MAELYPIVDWLHFKDISGQQFGRLTAIRPLGRTASKNTVWECRCECGNTTRSYLMSLRNGDAKSCGCWRVERMRKMARTHGMSGTPEFAAWHAMKQRCLCPADDQYCNYGARGITVCERWRESFENFYADMGPRPSAKHSIERRNNSKGYSPDNCVWATMLEQAQNRRTNRYATAWGITKTLSAWARDAGVNRQTLHERLRRGWTPEDALTRPAEKQRGRNC